MVELLNRTPRWLRHDEPAVAGLLLAGWLLEQDGPDVSDTIARAAVPTVDLDVLRDVVGDISYMLRQAQALEDDPAAALHALGIVVHPGNRIEDVAGERCDSLRQDARGAAEIAATRVPAAAPSSAVAGLLLAGWLLEQDGPDVSDTIARAAVPTVDLDVLRDVVGDISYMLRQAQALEDDPAAALHALGIVVHAGNRIEDVAGERCDSLRQDARGAAEIAATPRVGSAPSSEVTRGLRDLADFLDQHPDVPLPDYPTVQANLARDDVGLAALGRIAAILGSPVDLTRDGHRRTEREFGPVRYVASSITEECMAAWDALTSYQGSVSA